MAITFGGVVKGVALGTLAVAGAAVGFDDVGDFFDGLGNLDNVPTDLADNLNNINISNVEDFLKAAHAEGLDMDIVNKIPHDMITGSVPFETNSLTDAINEQSWADTVEKFFDKTSDLAADGLAWTADKVGIINSETGLAFTDTDMQNVGFADDVTGVYDAAAEVGGAAVDVIKDIPEAAGHAWDEHKSLMATSAVVGGVGTYAATNRGKHTARVEQERGAPSNIASVARGAGTVARRTAGLTGDLIKTAGSTVGGVASSVNRATART